MTCEQAVGIVDRMNDGRKNKEFETDRPGARIVDVLKHPLRLTASLLLRWMRINDPASLGFRMIPAHQTGRANGGATTLHAARVQTHRNSNGANDQGEKRRQYDSSANHVADKVGRNRDNIQGSPASPGVPYAAGAVIVYPASTIASTICSWLVVDSS